MARRDASILSISMGPGYTSFPSGCAIAGAPLASLRANSTVRTTICLTLIPPSQDGFLPERKNKQCRIPGRLANIDPARQSSIWLELFAPDTRFLAYSVRDE